MVLESGGVTQREKLIAVNNEEKRDGVPLAAQEREQEETRLTRKGDEDGEARREEELRNRACRTKQEHVPGNGNVQWTFESRGG